MSDKSWLNAAFLLIGILLGMWIMNGLTPSPNQRDATAQMKCLDAMDDARNNAIQAASEARRADSLQRFINEKCEVKP